MSEVTIEVTRQPDIAVNVERQPEVVIERTGENAVELIIAPQPAPVFEVTLTATPGG